MPFAAKTGIIRAVKNWPRCQAATCRGSTPDKGAQRVQDYTWVTDRASVPAPNRTCEICAARFYVQPHILKRKHNTGRYCSNRCKGIGRSYNAHPPITKTCPTCKSHLRSNTGYVDRSIALSTAPSHHQRYPDAADVENGWVSPLAFIARVSATGRIAKDLILLTGREAST